MSEGEKFRYALLEIFFLPPMAIARFGSSETPLEAFDWVEDTTAHGANKTAIRPAVTFEVKPDRSLRPYMPETIRFKDEDKVRPVAPFFELWARVQSSRSGETIDLPLTLELLRAWRMKIDQIRYRVTASNRKAARRTGDNACVFTSRVEVSAGDHERRELLAHSPHTAGQAPLVLEDQAISLGAFEVIRPVDETVTVGSGSTATPVDLSILRVRFTPAAGRVYGPPTARSGPASVVPPGEADAPSSEYGRIHEIVPPENRILSPDTPWSEFIMGTGLHDDPKPQDTYDGANVGNNRSWGVVDDSCDLVIEASLVLGGEHFLATARAFAAPPDFAPDRRPIVSLADDLADRELPVMEVTAETFEEVKPFILDLFSKAFETAGLYNLDAGRAWAIRSNESKESRRSVKADANLPATGEESMTRRDKSFVDKVPELVVPQAPSAFTAGVRNDRLPHTDVVPFVHARFTEEKILLDFLRKHKEYVKRLIRPAFGVFEDWHESPGSEPNPRFRDPRVHRDTLYDMRMPPYMRGSGAFPLSLGRRQYKALMDFLNLLDDPKVASRAAEGSREAHLSARTATEDAP